MQFLKNNKQIFSIVFLLPFFFFYLDRTIIAWVRDFHTYHFYVSSLFRYADPLIDFIAHGMTLIVMALMLYVIGSFSNHRLYEVGRSLFIGLISAGISVQVLKHLIGRARPRLTDNSIFIGPSLKSGYDSFPSGHTALAFCLAYILSHHFPRYRILFYLFAVIVSLERIEDLAHFPSDVLAGAMIGLIVGRILLLKMFCLMRHYAREN